MRSFTDSPVLPAQDTAAGADAAGLTSVLGDWTAVGATGGAAHAAKIGTLLIHEPDHVRQSRVVAQLAVLVARNVVDLADGGEHLRLFDGVNPEVGFEIEIQIQHVFRIAGLLHHQGQNAFLHGIAVGVGLDRNAGAGAQV